MPLLRFNGHVSGAVDHARWARAGGRDRALCRRDRATVCFAPRRPRGHARGQSHVEPSLPGAAPGGCQPHLARRPAFDDALLRFLGRQHSAAEALAAVDLAARLFARFSFDLFYGP
jgi:hypothetical protein